MRVGWLTQHPLAPNLFKSNWFSLQLLTFQPIIITVLLLEIVKRALLCPFNVLNSLNSPLESKEVPRSNEVVWFLFVFSERHASCPSCKFRCWRKASEWIDFKRKSRPVQFPRQDERALLGRRERRSEGSLEKERFYYQWSRSYRRNSHWFWYIPLTD